ncbi:hypothetical protein CCHR01_16997 [Colletotrichum chrysophilum]|uniref:Uncharacterized protein n=1 Tax=Colletotrichum chrysophilum TaxID=1836956 RepID=A0AAD9A393_9PEZI|nr:hypothetical protein CCHR01_16997 [Colletotrichum chrysophilum]
MPPQQRRNADAYDSDSSFPPDDECDVNDDDCFDDNDQDGSLGTDATDVEPLCEDDDFDLEDQIRLFDGNVHPPEYWLRELEGFNEDAFACQDYSPGTTVLLDAVEEQWHQ